MKYWISISAAIFAVPLLCANPADESTFLLKGATLHTMAGADIPDGSVMVTNGRITGVGRNLNAPAGTRVIDVSGLHVYPGFIDAASEVGLSEIGAVRESSDVQEIGKFNPQLSSWEAVNPSSEHILVTRANGISSVVALPEGELIAGHASFIHLDGWTTEEMKVKGSAALYLLWPTIQTHSFHYPEGPVTKPYDEIKKDHDKRLQELNGFIEDARRYSKAKAAHASDFQVNLRLEAMTDVIDGETPVMIEAMREREIREAVDFADRQKLRMILSGGAEAWKVTGLLKEHHIPVVLRPTLSLPEEEDEPYDQPFSTPGLLAKSDILFCFASYSAEFSRNLPYQAAAAVPFGLSHDAALKSITINTARIFGLEKQLGSIEEGKLADLMVTDGDPLETRTEVKHLFINGRDVSLNNKQLQLYLKYKSRPN